MRGDDFPDAKKAVEEEKKARNDLAANAGVKKFEAAVPKATAAKKKALDRMEQAEKLAQGAIDNANTCMHRTYDEEMPEILNVCFLVLHFFFFFCLFVFMVFLWYFVCSSLS